MQNISDSKEKIALDVVLLLPPEVAQLCIDTNTRFASDEYIRFTDGYNPHITLAMGVVANSDFDNFRNDIEEVLKNWKPLYLSLSGFHPRVPGWFDISSTVELQELHEQISNIMIKYATRDATPEMCFEPEKVAPDSGALRWINVFDTEKSFENYEPHISICKGDTSGVSVEPKDFVARTIGIFHYGVHGTCKHELARFTLGV
mgnify:FL=1